MGAPNDGQVVYLGASYDLMFLMAVQMDAVQSRHY